MRPEVTSYGAVVQLAALGWVPFCVALFLMVRPSKAVAIGLVTGFLVYPVATFDLPLIPAYDKRLATVLGPLVGALLMDSKRWLGFRPRWVDLPVAALCAAPVISALLNGHALHAGAANSFDFCLRWGAPWLLGRLYFMGFEDQKTFARVIIAGALIYVPFALFEVKMSPQFHQMVYGYGLKAFKHSQRAFGLWRPNVLAEHGLFYGLYNAFAALLAFWLWFTKAERRIGPIGMGTAAVVLFGMSLAIQSMNATLMMMVGMAILVSGSRWNWALPVVVLVAAAPCYVYVRQGLQWDGQELVEVADEVFGRSRAISLNVRLENEANLSNRIAEKPWFGYDDFREFTGNTDSKANAIVDSMWLLYLGLYGLFALTALYAMELLPAIFLWRKLPARYWAHPALAAGVTFALLTLLIVLDQLLNATDIAMFTAGGGGATALLGTPEGRRLWT